MMNNSLHKVGRLCAAGGYTDLENIEVKLDAKMDWNNRKNQENFAVIRKADDNNLITF